MKKELKRCLALVLVLSLILMSVIPFPVFATNNFEGTTKIVSGVIEDFTVIDSAKMIRFIDNGNSGLHEIETAEFGYENGFATVRLPIVYNNISGNLKMLQTAIDDGDIEASLYYDNYKICDYFISSYGQEYGGMMYSDWDNEIILYPKLTDDSGNCSYTVYDLWGSANYSVSIDQNDYDEFWGLQPEFMNYVKMQTTLNEVKDLVKWVAKTENNKKFKIVLTIDGVDYPLEKYSAGTYNSGGFYTTGVFVESNRLEDLTKEHEANSYEQIKSYKGNLYVSEEDTAESVVLPYKNRTNYKEANSLYVDGRYAFADGNPEVTRRSGLNLCSIYPEPFSDSTTTEEYVRAYLNIINENYQIENHESEYISSEAFQVAGTNKIKISNDDEEWYDLKNDKLYGINRYGYSIYTEKALSQYSEYYDGILGNTDIPVIELRQSRLGSVDKKDALRIYINYLTALKDFAESTSNKHLKGMILNQEFEIKFTNPSTNERKLAWSPVNSWYGLGGQPVPPIWIDFSQGSSQGCNSDFELTPMWDVSTSSYTIQDHDGTYPYFIKSGYKTVNQKDALVYNTYVRYKVSKNQSDLENISNRDSGTPVGGLDYYYYDDGTSKFMNSETSFSHIFDANDHSAAYLLETDEYNTKTVSMSFSDWLFNAGRDSEKETITRYSLDEVIGILTCILQNTSDKSSLAFISQFVPVKQTVMDYGPSGERYSIEESVRGDLISTLSSYTSEEVIGEHYGVSIYEVETAKATYMYGGNSDTSFLAPDGLIDEYYKFLQFKDYIKPYAATKVDYSGVLENSQQKDSVLNNGSAILDKGLFNQTLGYKNQVDITYYAESGTTPSFNKYIPYRQLIHDGTEAQQLKSEFGDEDIIADTIINQNKRLYECMVSSVNDINPLLTPYDINYWNSSWSNENKNGAFSSFVTGDLLYKTDYATVVFANRPDTPTKDGRSEYKDVVSNIQNTITWDVPEDNGAEIIGYQIAVVPRGKEVTDSDWINNHSYKDIADIYEIKYATDSPSFDVTVNQGEAIDVYIKAVNVMGSSTGSLKYTLISAKYCELDGPDTIFRTQKDVNYDTLDTNHNNVEEKFNYSMNIENEEDATITSEGILNVSETSDIEGLSLISVGKSDQEFEGSYAVKNIKIVDLVGPDTVQKGSENEYNILNGTTDVTDDYVMSVSDPAITVTDNKITIPQDYENTSFILTAIKVDDPRTSATKVVHVDGGTVIVYTIDGPNTLFRTQKDVDYNTLDENGVNVEPDFEYAIPREGTGASIVSIVTEDGKFTPGESSTVSSIRITSDGKPDSSYNGNHAEKDIKIVDFDGPSTGKNGDTLIYKVFENGIDVTDQYFIVPSDGSIPEENGILSIPDNYGNATITVTAIKKDDPRVTTDKQLTISNAPTPTPPSPTPSPSPSPTPAPTPAPTPSPTPAPTPTPTPTPTPSPTPTPESVEYDIEGPDEVECGEEAEYSLEPTPDFEVTWRIDGEDFIGTAIDSDGVLTVDEYETADEIVVSAYDEEDNLVASKDVMIIRNISISISGANKVVKGQSATYTATVKHSLEGVDWQLLEVTDSGTKITAKNSDLKGLLKVALGEQADEITIVATSLEDPDIRATKKVKLVGIKKDKNDKTLPETGDNYNPFIFIWLGISLIVAGIAIKRKLLH